MGFKERLKEARNAAELTGDKLGEAVGYSKQNVSHWEAGRFEPNLETLIKLCEVLEVSADWLLLGKSPEELSPAAIRQARDYDRLTPEEKRRWETAKSLITSKAKPESSTELRRRLLAKLPKHLGPPIQEGFDADRSGDIQEKKGK